jgi:flagellum-specific peptidoglycan hydrolase FlgJ
VHTLPLPKMPNNPAPHAPSEVTTQPVENAAGASSAAAHLTGQQLQFLLRVAPAAVASERACGIPACVTIAQAILESSTPQYGWGSSPLFRLANNPFGIKYCHFGSGDPKMGRSSEQTPNLHTLPGSPQPIIGSSGHAVSGASDYGHFDVTTWEVENGQKKVICAEFQKFPSLDEAFRAHTVLLCGPRYHAAYEVRSDWKEFAERLGPKASPTDTKHCGYSTNPSYSAELIKLVSLYRLDDPRALAWFATGVDPGHQAAANSSPLVANSSQLTACS